MSTTKAAGSPSLTMMIDSHEISDRARLLSHQLFVERLREEPDLLNVAKDAVARIAGSEGATLGEAIWLELLRADLEETGGLRCGEADPGRPKGHRFRGAAYAVRAGEKGRGQAATCEGAADRGFRDLPAASEFGFTPEISRLPFRVMQAPGIPSTS
jgi:hypothetical protein